MGGYGLERGWNGEPRGWRRRQRRGEEYEQYGGIEYIPAAAGPGGQYRKESWRGSGITPFQFVNSARPNGVGLVGEGAAAGGGAVRVGCGAVVAWARRVRG
jgi:hypothetical protein